MSGSVAETARGSEASNLEFTKLTENQYNLQSGIELKLELRIN